LEDKGDLSVRFLVRSPEAEAVLKESLPLLEGNLTRLDGDVDALEVLRDAADRSGQEGRRARDRGGSEGRTSGRGGADPEETVAPPAPRWVSAEPALVEMYA
jgi:hypothetical protein